MIIFTNNFLAAPLLLLIWAIDTYLFLCGLRWILSGFAAARAASITGGLRPLTDPLVDRAGRWLQQMCGSSVRPWAPWALVVGALFVVRSLLVFLVSHAIKASA